MLPPLPGETEAAGLQTWMQQQQAEPAVTRLQFEHRQSAQKTQELLKLTLLEVAQPGFVPCRGFRS